MFVNALYQNDQQFVALNSDLAGFTNTFTNTNSEVATACRTSTSADDHPTVRRQERRGAGHDINNLADVTNAILQPEPRDGLETGLHVFPNLAANLVNIFAPSRQAASSVRCITQLRQPDAVHLQLDSGRQPAGLPGVRRAVRAVPGADPGRDQVQLSAIRAQPGHHRHARCRSRSPTPSPGCSRRRATRTPPCPAIWSRDTLLSLGNHEPGWVVAPGMQGVHVQPLTANMLTPESLAELMGGPRQRVPRPQATNMVGPPNAYGENNPLPPPWYPQPGPPPAPAPGVIPGDPGSTGCRTVGTRPMTRLSKVSGPSGAARRGLACW